MIDVDDRLRELAELMDDSDRIAEQVSAFIAAKELDGNRPLSFIIGLATALGCLANAYVKSGIPRCANADPEQFYRLLLSQLRSAFEDNPLKATFTREGPKS